MKLGAIRATAVLGGVLLAAGTASAQTTVNLPDSSQTTLMRAIVAEQATVTVPATVTFNVADVTQNTAASAASVTVTGIVLSSPTKQLRVSLQANSAGFTPPAASPTWTAGHVSWNASTWTNGLGTAGTLSSASYGTIAECTAAATACSTTGLVFTLAANASVTMSGNHDLNVTWKFESF